ncbi:DNA polymerase IV [Abyssisolibacter fermentans]|uniref:DNA polymerase IV n=1 Tax=Abyssisolibacter fermentans TaxID=1766203 RepID=UPI0008314098|nr:DNA polymerase IV [Abyssisolibacter fermentans]
MKRKIIHVDMDAFFAAVEQHDNNKLKGKPVIVGGIGKRGVVSTCSYEARKYGVHSAMPTFIAKKKCPNAIFVPVRMARYKEISSIVFNILYEITELVEPLSIDEAYLDVTKVNSDSIDIARYIKKEVKRKTGLTLSAGISYNKFLAKLASDWNKPNGIKVISKDMMPDILLPLSIKKVYGLGKKSVQMFNKFGVYTIKDLYGLPKEYLIEVLGKHGEDIFNRIRGIDDREINMSSDTKSIGRETTLKEDTRNKQILKDIIKDFSINIGKSLTRKKLFAKTVTVKYKTIDFTIHTKSKTLDNCIQKQQEVYKVACDIIDNIKFNKDIRLIGLSVSHLDKDSIKQLSIFDFIDNY